MQQATSSKWEDRTERILSLRSGQGRPLRIVREVYLRSDVPCYSSLCTAGCANDSDALLPNKDEVTHYLVPDCHVTRHYLELFERPDIQGVVFTQTAAHYVQHEGSRRLAERLRRLARTPGAGCVLLYNEFLTHTHCLQEPDESVAEWQTRAIYRVAAWLYDHLEQCIPVVMVTSTEKAAEAYMKENMGVLVTSFDKYVTEFWKGQSALLDLHTSLSEAATATKDVGKQFSGYLPQTVLDEGLKTGRFVRGRLNVNRFNASSEAFVSRNEYDLTDESGLDILVVGSKDRNRAVHGDEVVVEIYPKSQWRVRSLAINITEENEMEDKEDKDNENSENVDKSSDRRLPTGRVVGVLRRQWRDFVVSLSPDEEVKKDSNKSGKILVIPWDYRIPRIRIATRQVDIIKEQRCLVRIDDWPANSQYPNGHLVKVLGPIGNLETEVAALLAENELTTSDFTPAQLAELPSDTPDNPWQMSAEEIERRRDLRQSHLVFSIDPKDCEDVDDTMSIRKLDNGNLEVGVHIADVTYFVRVGSLTDREAQRRSTTVYLADRRCDMLPGVLSTNLCSLVSGRDRYAVSVMWEVTPKHKVVNVWYGRTIIHSQYKLFYEMAQQINDGCSDKDIVDGVPELQSCGEEELAHRLEQLRWSLEKLVKMGRWLKDRRTRSGALELESVEVQVQLTETKGVENLTPKEHLEVHETIAESMIFANHLVAKKIAKSFPTRALLRNHPPPRQEQFENLQKCAAMRGFHINTSSNKALAESLDASTDAKDPVVNSLLRSLATMAMSNARYFNTGTMRADEFSHYGLALDQYTHFTSPIRRYADIVVHRMLLAAVQMDAGEKEEVVCADLPGSRQLDELTNHMNTKHRAAQNAQRDSQELFQSMFFCDYEGNEEVCVTDAIIFQLRANGVLVFVPRYGVKGVAYLQDREGKVVYIPSSNGPQWFSGTMTRADEAITVECALGSQVYHLLEHITVRLSVNVSRAHCQSLKVEVVAKQPHNTGEGRSAKITTKADIVKKVKEGAENGKEGADDYQKEREEIRAWLDALDPELAKCRQPENSLYHLFQSFHREAMRADVL